MQGKDYIMANTIDTAFIKQFESEVHLAYQRMGSKLMNTVRNVSNVAGSVVRFQKIGTGTASTKSRNGMVTPMELTTMKYMFDCSTYKTKVHMQVVAYLSLDFSKNLKQRSPQRHKIDT